MEVLLCFCIGFVVGSVECGWSKAQFGEIPGWKGRETLNKDFPDKKKKNGEKKSFHSEGNV